MAQSTELATSTWQQIANGATDALVQNMGPNVVRVARQATTPTDDNAGVVVWPQGSPRGQHEYEVYIGTENLYLRAAAQTSTVEVTT